MLIQVTVLLCEARYLAPMVIPCGRDPRSWEYVPGGAPRRRVRFRPATISRLLLIRRII